MGKILHSEGKTKKRSQIFKISDSRIFIIIQLPSASRPILFFLFQYCHLLFLIIQEEGSGFNCLFFHFTCKVSGSYNRYSQGRD